MTRKLTKEEIEEYRKKYNIKNFEDSSCASEDVMAGLVPEASLELFTVPADKLDIIDNFVYKVFYIAQTKNKNYMFLTRGHIDDTYTN